MSVIRRGEAKDLAQVAAIQSQAPEAAKWDVQQYLQYHFTVAIVENAVAAYVVSRTLAEGEREVLNLAVVPRFRRRGIARDLLQSLLAEAPGAVFLEVRESNENARAFYKYMGFQEVGTRKNYYETPPEAAIVMKFHSC